MKFSITSQNTILITLCNNINIKCAKKIQKLYLLLKKEPFAREVVASYNTILVTFDILKDDFYSIQEKILALSKKANYINIKYSSKTIKIPVYYSKEVGFDLERVATINNLTIKEVISIHSNQIYYVYTIGFLPGFAYMGEVDNKIVTPRLNSPRKMVPKGSVAIANTQTSIYPKNSAGGWNIIGKTPIKLLSFSYKNFSLLKIGDRVKFIQINKDEFLKLGGEL